MDLAGDGEIFVSEKTSVLAAGQFDFEGVGKHSLKGVRDPELIFRVVVAAEVLA
jgi:class 3 adenylate cyclase